MAGRRFVASAIAGLALAGALGFPASFAQGRNVLRLDVRAGFDGLGRDGVPVPVLVVVESDSFFAGVVRVMVVGFNGLIVTERPLELPAGSRKALAFVATRPDISAVEVLDRQRRRVAAQVPSISRIGTDPLVGTLSTAPVAARTVTLPPVDRPGRVVPVGLEILDLGADALRALSHLVVEARSAMALSPRQREAVLGYAAAGGELIVAASSERDLVFLPAAWRGSGAGALRRTPAASGRVTVVLRPLSDADWSEGGPLWARALRPADARRWSAEVQGFDWALEALTSTGAFVRPSPGWLLGFVLGYVALVGPVNFLVLSRLRRRELAWVTVPALSLLFAAGAYAAGRGVRDAPSLQGTGVILVDAAARDDSMALAVLSRSGGVERIRLGGSWTAEPLTVSAAAGEEPVLRVAREATEVAFRLAVGGVGVVSARRVAPAEGPSAGTLAAMPDGFEGSVSNPLGVPLSRAGVFAGSGYAPTGSLTPGESRRVRVSVVEGGGAAPSLEELFFGGPFFDPEAAALPPLLRRAGAAFGVGTPGRAFLVGLADLGALGPRLGLGQLSGKVLVVAPLRVEARGTVLAGQAVRRSLVALDGGAIQLDVVEGRDAVVRFDLPSGRGVRRLVLGALGLDQFGVIVKPVPAPGRGIEPVPGSQPEAGPAVQVSVFDFAAGGWRAIDPSAGSADLSAAGSVERFVSPDGEVFIRLASEFSQPLPVGALTLEAVFA